MPRILWTPLAETELEDILLYIAIVGRNPSTAEKIYGEIRGRVNQHADK